MVGARREHLERMQQYGMGRAEVVLIPPEDLAWLPGYLAGRPHGFSFHAPALRQEAYADYPLKAALVDPDPQRRQAAHAMMRQELDLAAAWGAQHLVVHLQRNLLMDEEAPPRGWGEREGVDLAVQELGTLLEESRRVGVPVHLENMMGSPLLHSPAAYAELAAQLPDLRFCLDVGHAALDGKEYGFPEAELAAAMAPHLGSLHLYDNHLPPRVDFATLREAGLLRKYPVHPEHQGQPGWIDTQGCLEAALRAQPDVLVTFEVYYRLDEDHAHTAEGVAWTVERVRQLTGQV